MTAEIENPHQAALLLIDLINDFKFDGADHMLRQLAPAAEAICNLCYAARSLAVPIVYVNDNFGLWRSERTDIVRHCLGSDNPGRSVVELLAPTRDDYFVVKPRHSGFFATNLPVLLPDIRARRLIMVGVAADICVLFTANDAYMRDYRLWVPGDCIAASTLEKTERALEHMASVLKAETRPTCDLPLGEWLRSFKISDRFTEA